MFCFICWTLKTKPSWILSSVHKECCFYRFFYRLQIMRFFHSSISVHDPRLLLYLTLISLYTKNQQFITPLYIGGPLILLKFTNYQVYYFIKTRATKSTLHFWWTDGGSSMDDENSWIFVIRGAPYLPQHV